MTDEKNYDYNADCRKTNAIAFWAPFLITLLILGIWFNSALPLIGFIVALWLAFGAGAIGMIIGHQLNISKAREHDIPDNDPRFVYERNERNIGIIYGASTIADLTKHTKNSVHDVANVDGWKKSK